MKKLFFDIETIPASEEKHKILKEIHEKKLEDGKKVTDWEDYLEKTSLDGAFGRIACISYATEDEQVKTLCDSEEKMLAEFWEIAKGVDVFVGFNIMDFDLKFIFQRSIILGVKPSRPDLSFARYRNHPIYDIMKEWVKWSSNYITMDVLAKALGLESSKGGEVEGKNVAKAYEDGRIKEICVYCEKDVELTRKIYKRMIFEE